MNAWAVALYRLGGPLELILLFEWYRADTQHPHEWCRVFVVSAPVRHRVRFPALSYRERPMCPPHGFRSLQSSYQRGRWCPLQSLGPLQLHALGATMHHTTTSLMR